MNTNCLPLSLILNSCTTSTLQKNWGGGERLAVEPILGPQQTVTGQARAWWILIWTIWSLQANQSKEIQAEEVVRLDPQLPKFLTKCKTLLYLVFVCNSSLITPLIRDPVVLGWKVQHHTVFCRENSGSEDVDSDNITRLVVIVLGNGSNTLLKKLKYTVPDSQKGHLPWPPPVLPALAFWNLHSVRALMPNVFITVQNLFHSQCKHYVCY